MSLYFQVHQPRRIRRIGFFDISANTKLFDDELNRRIIRRISMECYEPANLMLLDLISRYPNIRVAFSISGTALEQLQQYSPEVIESFNALASTGAVEFLGETYYHSLSGVSDKDEFAAQVVRHSDEIQALFGARPTVFRNTELIYSDEVGRMAHELGFKAIYAEGIPEAGPINRLYHHPDDRGFHVLLRNFHLSDDVAFRFADRAWAEWPLTPEKYTGWMESGGLINLGMDYETFGEHLKANTGIFDFLERMLASITTSGNLRMVTPSEAIMNLTSKDAFHSPVVTSWADQEKDLSAWLGNELQRDAFRYLGKLGRKIRQLDSEELLSKWRYLQTSDHLYYMTTKRGDDMQVHAHFSPYPSPYEAFINYMNALSCLELAVEKEATSISHRIRKTVRRFRSMIEEVHAI